MGMKYEKTWTLLLALPHTHTTPSCLQVEEEDERKKKDSGRAHEVDLLKTLSCSYSPLYRHTGQSENLQGMALQYNAAMTITCTAIYCYHAATCSGYYAQQSFAAQE